MHFGGEAMKGGVCLFGLISNINSVSQKLLTAPLICSYRLSVCPTNNKKTQGKFSRNNYHYFSNSLWWLKRHTDKRVVIQSTNLQVYNLYPISPPLSHTILFSPSLCGFNMCHCPCLSQAAISRKFVCVLRLVTSLIWLSESQGCLWEHRPD